MHAAPEEKEVPVRQRVVLPPPQKHYKIIFIKAPSQTVYTPQYIPVPQPNEEKTIVYVLAKKPEKPQEIVIPKLEQKPPTKPEVFFIKYNNKDDSQAVINNIVSDYNKGHSVNFATGSGSTSNVGQVGPGIYGQTTGSGQYGQVGSGQYQTTGSGQYGQLGSGQYQSTGSGQYAQSTVGYTNPAQIVTSGSSTSSGGNINSLSTVGNTSSSTSSANYDTVNTISTSQAVPHETYGVPKFRE